MFRFSIKQLAFVTAAIAVLISARLAYLGWLHDFRLSEFDVSFSIEGEELTTIDDAITLPRKAIDHDLLRMDWKYTFSNNAGESSVHEDGVRLHPDQVWGGFYLRQSPDRHSDQGPVKKKGVSSRLFWSSETVAGGCILYVAVHLNNDGELVDNRLKTVRLQLPKP